MKKNKDIKTKHYVNIKGVDYEIKVIEKNDFIKGRTDIQNHIVSIVKTTKEDTKRTIIHELLHAYFHECGLPHYDDEILIYFLGYIFLDLEEKLQAILKIIKL